MKKAMMVFAALVLTFPCVVLAAQGAAQTSIIRTSVSKHAGPGTSAYSFKLIPPSADVSIKGQVTWFAEVLGPKGVVLEGIDLHVDPADSTKVTVIVEDSVIGDVLLYGRYDLSTGKFGTRKTLVVSRPAGKTMTGIILDLKYNTLAIDDIRIPEIWAQYDNGAKNVVNVEPGSLQITSSNPACVSVSPGGDLKAVEGGSSTITASYKGFTSQVTLTVSPRQCFIKTSANPSSAGTVNPGYLHDVGSLAAVSADAREGYEFTNWTSNGQVVSTSPSYVFTVKAAQELVANFAPTNNEKAAGKLCQGKAGYSLECPPDWIFKSGDASAAWDTIVSPDGKATVTIVYGTAGRIIKINGYKDYRVPGTGDIVYKSDILKEHIGSGKEFDILERASTTIDGMERISALLQVLSAQNESPYLEKVYVMSDNRYYYYCILFTAVDEPSFQNNLGLVNAIVNSFKRIPDELIYPKLDEARKSSAQ